MGIVMNVLGFLGGLEKFCLVPLVLFILAVCFGVKPKVALRSALMFGAGLLGILTIANTMYAYMGDVVNGLIGNTNVQNTVLDIGMSGLFGAVVSLPFFPFIYPIGIAMNIFLIAIGWTKTFDVDFLTYFGFLLPGLTVYIMTGNIIWVVVLMFLFFACALKIADWTAPMLEEYYNMKGISIPHHTWGPAAAFVIFLDWIIDKIPGVRDIDINLGSLGNKLGIFGDPAFISFAVGLVLGLIAKLPLGTAIAVGMALVFTVYLYPKAIGIMMEGLTPISQAMREFGMKHLHKDNLYMGMDAAIYAGYPEIVAATSVLIPIALVIYFFLPGSRLIPTAETLQIAIMVGMIMPFAGKKGHKGNVFRTLVIGAIMCVVMTWFMMLSAPYVTELAKQTGYDLGGLSEVTSFGYVFLNCIGVFICKVLGL